MSEITYPTSIPVADSTCEACGARVLIVHVGGLGVDAHPCDPLPVLMPAVGLVVRNPATGAGRVVEVDVLPSVPGWQRNHGATLHRSHRATCPFAHRLHAPGNDPPGQGALL